MAYLQKGKGTQCEQLEVCVCESAQPQVFLKHVMDVFRSGLLLAHPVVFPEDMVRFISKIRNYRLSPNICLFHPNW